VTSHSHMTPPAALLCVSVKVTERVKREIHRLIFMTKKQNFGSQFSPFQSDSWCFSACCFLFLTCFFFYSLSSFNSFFLFFPSCFWRLCCPCLWWDGTAGSQSERGQSGAGGQHPAGERCSEDKPSCSRTGNELQRTSLRRFSLKKSSFIA